MATPEDPDRPEKMKKKPLHIASLGSSFAAGPSLAPVADRDAARSTINYAGLLAARRGPGALRVTDLSVTGATLAHVLDTPRDDSQSRPGCAPFPPQVRELLPADAGAVLLLAGGADAGYVEGMHADTARSHWVGAFMDMDEGVEPRATAEAAGPAAEDGICRGLGAVLDGIHERCPGARVLVLEHLTLMGPDVRPRGGGHDGGGGGGGGGGDGERRRADVLFGPDRVEHHRAVAAMLQRATARAVGERAREGWCRLVPVAAASEGHGVGSAEPWVEGFSWRLVYAGGAFHPNAAGMEAVSRMLEAELVALGLLEEEAAQQKEGSIR